MARSKAATRKAKAAYSRKYRRSAHGKAVTRAYGKRTVKQRSSRNKARRKLGVKKGGGDVHHKDRNPRNNSKSNLAVKKSHHSGGTKGPNRNAAKKRGRRRKK